MKNDSGEEAKIIAFWNWFETSNQRLSQWNSSRDENVSEILSKLKTIVGGLAVELNQTENGVTELTISADGNIDNFPVVSRIVAAAPKLENWQIRAFRKRLPLEKASKMEMSFEGVILKPSQMFFWPIDLGDSLDVIVYLQGLTAENRNFLSYFGLMVLDNLLGEYDCVKRVRSYDFHAITAEGPERTNARPLLEIASYVDAWCENLNNKED